MPFSGVVLSLPSLHKAAVEAQPIVWGEELGAGGTGEADGEGGWGKVKVAKKGCSTSSNGLGSGSSAGAVPGVCGCDAETAHTQAA